MKQIQGNVREKINEYVHAWCEFPFVLLLFFNFFPKFNHFYYLTSLLGLQAVENHCGHLRPVGKIFHISAFPLYYSLYNWIGEHEITKLKKKKCFEFRKKHSKTSTKRPEWNGMTQNGLFNIFSIAHAETPSILHQ